MALKLSVRPGSAVNRGKKKARDSSSGFWWIKRADPKILLLLYWQKTKICFSLFFFFEIQEQKMIICQDLSIIPTNPSLKTFFTTQSPQTCNLVIESNSISHFSTCNTVTIFCSHTSLFWKLGDITDAISLQLLRHSDCFPPHVPST